MAERRMFSLKIIDSDAFLNLPISAQCLYFHLSMRADDDGFVNKPRAIMNMIGAKDDDMNMLLQRKFVLLDKTFESKGIVVIKHWRIHNSIQKDRYHETAYKFEKARLYLDENNAYSFNPQEPVYPKCIQSVSKMETEARLGKAREELGEDKNKAIYLSSEKNPMNWEGLARVSLRLGNIDEAYHYARQAEENGCPFDIEALKDEING